MRAKEWTAKVTAGLGAAVLLISCGQHLRGSKVTPELKAPAPTARVALSRADYQRVRGLSPDALARRAQIGELGNCQLQPVSEGSCESGQSYALFLTNQKVYFRHEMRPLNEKYTTMCISEAGNYAAQLMDSGLCFDSPVLTKTDLLELDQDALARRAEFKKLGNCVLFETMGCANGFGYMLYLTDRQRFFPSMSQVGESLGCFERAAPLVKKALEEDYCL